MPVLGFSIYNPDKKVITEFTKNELQFYAMLFKNGFFETCLDQNYSHKIERYVSCDGTNKVKCATLDLN